MAVQVTYPGVYIDEFEPGAPIEGVGTSTAAFIGPAELGDLNDPIKITSWDQFKTSFGAQPLPGFYLWYAVRGFFENQGHVCYVVRASNGDYAEVLLQNRAQPQASDIVRVRAVKPGLMVAAPPTVQVDVIPTNRLLSADTSLFQPASTYTETALREIQLPTAANAAEFKPGDWVDLGLAGTRVQILRVSGDLIRLASDLATPVNSNGNIRLADAPAGTTRTVRIAYNQPAANSTVPDGTLVAGTILTITQGANADTQVVESVQMETIDPANPNSVTYRVTFRQDLDTPLSMTTAGTVQSEDFNFRVLQGAAVTQYDNLSQDPAHPRYFIDYINTLSQVVKLEMIEPPPPDPMPASLLVTTNGPVPLVGGANETLSTLSFAEYDRALDTLQQIDDVNLVAIPDALTLRTALGLPDVPAITTVQQHMISHCELMGDRFAVLDARPGLGLFGTQQADGVDTQRRTLDSERGFGALYYPWLCVSPAGPGPQILVPPSGHMCGIIARSDNTKGVFKAPANEIVAGTIGVERTMSDIDQGQLNLLGVNVIRVFQTGGRPQLWGARTTATNKSWLHVSTRRLFLYLEESIQEGIRWAVFEPNNLTLWSKLRRTIRAFLVQEWRNEAMFGATADEAFYVRIDEVLNPFSEQSLGRLHIEIGVRPSYPAEFIIVRIGIWPGGANVEEG